MSNIVNFESAKLPAHISAMFGSVGNAELSEGVGQGYAVISYKGKVWHIVRGEDRELVANDEGEPRSSLEVVLLKANPQLSKVWYAKGYEEGSSAAPDCYSNNGLTPEADVEEPQATKCAVCPHNQWGSRITETGGKGKACSDSRRMAIVPGGQLNDPMLLRVPAGSLKDLSQYGQSLDKRGVPYQAVVTKVSFDHTVAHPKFVFKPVRFLNEDELAEIKAVLEERVVNQIIGTEASPHAVERAAERTEKAAPATAKAAPKVSQEEVEDAIAAAPATKAEKAAKPKAEKVAAEPVEAAEKPAKAAPKVQIDMGEIDDVLASLDD